VKFRSSFRVAAPQEAVSAFHQDPKVLGWLTPFPIVLRFHHVQPVEEGSVFKFTIWLAILPVPWVARHQEIAFPDGFVDEQIKGPFKHWVHHHRFVEIDEGHTEVVDEIEASFRPHLLWGPVGVFMWLTLPLLFVYRAWKTRRLLEDGER
jgi:ligand-binding SRPBCC domain-containing protein